MSTHTDESPRGGKLRTAGTRGALTGTAITVLGLWSLLVPLIGPYFGYALSPEGPWTRPWAALWLQIVPGVVLLLGGIVLVLTRRRLLGLVAAALAAAAGLWLAIGFALWPWAPTGVPVGGFAGEGISAVEQIGMASGLGAVVTLLAGLAFGRFSVRSTRDVAAAQQEESQARSTNGSDTATRSGSPESGWGGRPTVPSPRHADDRQARRPSDA
ncbi:hypothetical protein [Actinomycetospora cinnamomea]|uniref:Secreted protein n=1 Tax=Actinomycetospora cinnamomea TaxID=663609 RepID=A0A2U1F2K7_9PSEU|nr:hypothetical protein [Actinomycetospora cinnamomea]PVZ06398.1 hypothetical protein C8D89_113136 [Actinomycetospora cinnamomea]